MRTDEQGTREYWIFRQLEEKLFIDQSAENLKQEELQNQATRAEEDRVKTATRVEQDRARAEADRVTTFARQDADRHLARRKLQLRHRLARLKLRQQYLGGNVTDMSTILEHAGGISQYNTTNRTMLSTEGGLRTRKRWGRMHEVRIK